MAVENGTFRRVCSQEAGEEGRGEGGGKGLGAQERTAQLVGRRQSWQLCGLWLAEDRVSEARWSWGPPLIPGGSVPGSCKWEREMSGLPWLLEDTFTSGNQSCLGLLSPTGKQLR